ncbi:hypothetical protein ACFU8W_24305 [Streptomyces sp. NPDC057565]|uniref:hypothetical protein n=1 Tax=Streptomyces sp. NPDC057565 TaxID=3346169 RepID=UPI0036A4258E
MPQPLARTWLTARQRVADNEEAHARAVVRPQPITMHEQIEYAAVLREQDEEIKIKVGHPREPPPDDYELLHFPEPDHPDPYDDDTLEAMEAEAKAAMGTPAEQEARPAALRAELKAMLARTQSP